MEQQQKDAPGTQSRSREIEQIDPVNLPRKPGEGQSDAVGRKKEGKGKEKVGLEKGHPLPGVPEDLEGVQGDFLGQGEADLHRNAEKNCIGDEALGISPGDPAPTQDQEGPACSKSQQCQADDHESEMIPLGNAEKPHEQQLIGERSSREAKDGHAHSHGSMSPRERNEGHGQNLPRAYLAVG